MPAYIEPCMRCLRDRSFTKLTFEVDPTKGDGSEPEHYRYVCKNGCLPTRWEAWRERRLAEKATRDLQKWVKNPKDTNA